MRSKSPLQLIGDDMDNPIRHHFSFYMVGMAQLVSAPDCGSGGRGFESLYPPSEVVTDPYLPEHSGTGLVLVYDGLSPSGKAQHFDCCIRWFESS